MINRIFKLVDVKRIEMIQREINFSEGNIIIRPDYMSICAADMRYYLGKRKKDVLQKKLPLALIHEAVGTVLYDFRDEFKVGTKVVLIPNQISDSKSEIKGNYRKDSIFLSSGADGFMQDYILIRHNRVISIPESKYYELYVLSELVSVAFNVAEAFETTSKTKKESFGIWGDGSVGFIMGLVLKSLYPEVKLYVFGKTSRKLQRFAFTTQNFLIDSIPSNLCLDHCFECVGGSGSEEAISQMIDMINPQGCVSLLGVSEDAVAINTRAVLEKGLTFIGNSRSELCDFQKAIDLITNNRIARKYLSTIISQTFEIKCLDDIYKAFDLGQINDFKTVLQWNI